MPWRKDAYSYAAQLAEKLTYLAQRDPNALKGIAAVVDAFYEQARRTDIRQRDDEAPES